MIAETTNTSESSRCRVQFIAPLGSPRNARGMPSCSRLAVYRLALPLNIRCNKLHPTCYRKYVCSFEPKRRHTRRANRNGTSKTASQPNNITGTSSQCGSCRVQFIAPLGSPRNALAIPGCSQLAVYRLAPLLNIRCHKLHPTC